MCVTQSNNQNPFAGHYDSLMAPPDLAWHYRYVRTMFTIQVMLDELANSAGRGGDLSDYTETLSNLIGHRPQTRREIETLACARRYEMEEDENE